MYPNLEAEMTRKKINLNDIAIVIGRNPRTARNKLDGSTGLKVEEAQAIKDNLFPECGFEYLFEREV